MSWRVKLYGVSLCLILTALIYLGVEGLAHLTLKDSALLSSIEQSFPEQRSTLRSRWLGALAQANAQADLKLSVTLIGLSTLRDGVDVPTLRATLKRALNSKRSSSEPFKGEVLSLSGSGGTLKSLRYLTAPILSDPRYRSRVGVILLHPMWLAGWEASPPAPPPPAGASRQAHLSAQLKEVAHKGLWLLSHKALLSQGVNVAISSARNLYLETLWGLPPTVNVAPFKATQGAEPWFKPPVHRAQAQGALQLLKRQWSAWQQMGRGETALYVRHHKEQLKALKAMIESAEGRVDHWLIVRMAERSELRALPPPYALELLTERSLRDHLGCELNLWDASAIVPDEGFFDYAHLNEEGRGLFTHALAAHLSSLLRD